MKIQEGVIIQNRMIRENTKDDFWATYKGKEIFITTDHGHGKPHERGMNRFDIVVRDHATGMLDVNTWEDFYHIEKAILYALKGACLIK